MNRVIFRTRGGKDWIPRYVVSINKENCIGCGRCYKVCGRGVLSLIDCEDYENDDTDSKAYMSIANLDNCIGCEACARVCPKKCFIHEEVTYENLCG